MALTSADEQLILNRLRDVGFSRRQGSLILAIVKQVSAASSASSTPAATPGQSIVNALVFGRR